MWNNITDEDIDKADSDFGIGGEPLDLIAAGLGDETAAEERVMNSP
jgi:hypothetical protein